MQQCGGPVTPQVGKHITEQPLLQDRSRRDQERSDKRARLHAPDEVADASPRSHQHEEAKQAPDAGPADIATVKPSAGQWSEKQPEAEAAAEGPQASDAPSSASDQRKAEEQELRLKALKSLSSLKKLEDNPEDGLDLVAEDMASPDSGNHKRHSSSKSKHGHKKKKHHRRERDKELHEGDAVANGS